MILFLCYVFPPAAVLLMGRPFSALLSMFLTVFGWVPGVKHALTLYADFKIDNGVKDITRAVHSPKWVQQSQPAPRKRSREAAQPVYDSPFVGMNGTRFRRR